MGLWRGEACGQHAQPVALSLVTLRPCEQALVWLLHGPYVPDVPLAATDRCETAASWREPQQKQQEGRDTAEGGQLPDHGEPASGQGHLHV